MITPDELPEEYEERCSDVTQLHVALATLLDSIGTPRQDVAVDLARAMLDTIEREPRRIHP